MGNGVEWRAFPPPYKPMQFAGFTLRNNLFVAPMAGVTDRPFRQLCKKMGAGLAVSEMVTSNSLLYGSAKTQRRANHDGEVDPISVQIAGADPGDDGRRLPELADLIDEDRRRAGGEGADQLDRLAKAVAALGCDDLHQHLADGENLALTHYCLARLERTSSQTASRMTKPLTIN